MKIKLLLLSILFSVSFTAQEKFTISGYIKDLKNGEALTRTTIDKKGTHIGAVANEYGFYSLTLPEGEHVLLVSFIGYKAITFPINLEKSITKKFELSEES